MTDDTTATAAPGKNPTLALHAGCILLIAICLGLAFTVLKPYPEASAMLVGCAGWLYGKLGFKPANPVLENIIQTLEPARVEMIMSQRPPAPPSLAASRAAIDPRVLDGTVPIDSSKVPK